MQEATLTPIGTKCEEIGFNSISYGFLESAWRTPSNKHCQLTFCISLPPSYVKYKQHQPSSCHKFYTRTRLCSVHTIHIVKLKLYIIIDNIKYPSGTTTYKSQTNIIWYQYPLRLVLLTNWPIRIRHYLLHTLSDSTPQLNMLTQHKTLGHLPIFYSLRFIW